MWLVSTFEKIYLKKIFFVSTFLDWYNISKPFIMIILKVILLSSQNWLQSYYHLVVLQPLILKKYLLQCVFNTPS